jgi:hypothetical protein
MLHTEKQKTFQHIIKSLWCLCKKRILYKYQITFIVFTLDCLIIGGLNVRFLAGDRLQIVVIRHRNLSVY